MKLHHPDTEKMLHDPAELRRLRRYLKRGLIRTTVDRNLVYGRWLATRRRNA